MYPLSREERRLVEIREIDVRRRNAVNQRCKANSDAQRTGVIITIRQGRVGDTRPMIGDLVDNRWPMVGKSGVVTRTDTQTGTSNESSIQYAEVDNNRPLDLTNDGCLCIDW